MTKTKQHSPGGPGASGSAGVRARERVHFAAVGGHPVHRRQGRLLCAVLPLAPSTYYAHKTQEADPTLRFARAQRDEHLRGEIRRVWQDNLEVYGARKVWRQLKREGAAVTRCTVEG